MPEALLLNHAKGPLQKQRFLASFAMRMSYSIEPQVALSTRTQFW
jgi:hypothetical protein